MTNLMKAPKTFSDLKNLIFNMEAEKKLKKIQKKSNKFADKMKKEIRSLCEMMSSYQDSSRFSYNIDKLEQFVKEINEFKLSNK